jgi:type IV secretory pathway VirB10-like protein
VGRLSKRKAVAFTVLAAATLTLAGYNAYAKRVASRTFEADQAFASAAFEGMQVSNRAAKANSLLVRTALTTAEIQPSYTVASADPDAVPDRPVDPVIAATPTIPAATPPPPEPKAAAVAPSAPLPHAKPAAEKTAHLPPPAQSNLLDDNQISGLKGRLRLTSDQVEYWPAVESALRDVVRTQLRGSVKPGHGVRPNIDVNSPEVQKLIWAAMPLLMRLREDQKSEVRKLARVIGLEQVASQI